MSNLIALFLNPSWIRKDLMSFKSIDDIPDEIFEDIGRRLKQVTSTTPDVTVCIPAYNEELNIIRCLDSLSRSSSSINFDIIVVNNNSADRTQEVLDRLGVQSYFQPVAGCGPAREMAQQKAKGKYILLADADCLYPANWVEVMHKHLRKNEVVAVYSRHAFIGDDTVPRWHYAMYETFKRLMLEIRHLQRPYLNAYGMSMGYIRRLGLKEGFVERNIRGEDGRMCFDLMKHGKIKFVRSRKAVVWTQERNFAKEGGFFAALKKKVLLELVRFQEYFKKPEQHDTKTSENFDHTEEEYKAILRSRLSIKKKRTVKSTIKLVLSYLKSD